MQVSNLLTAQQLHPYQKDAVLHGLYHDDVMYWLQMGLGKTPITLTVMVDRMRAGQVKKVLVFGPLRVIQSVWHREARKWAHTQHLRFSILHGSKEKRTRALFADADVYLCNYEAMNWLSETLDHFYTSRGLPIPFDMVVYDEITKVKNSTSVRVAGWKRDVKDSRTGEMVVIKKTGWRKFIDQFKFRVGLTGSPAANGYQDLHGQFLVVDGGKRLGPYKTHFMDSYFTKGYDGWSHQVTAIGKTMIEQKISDITLKMDAAEYLPHMPKCKTVDVMIALPPEARKVYDKMEEELFAKLDSGVEVEVFNKASASIKCLQIANGSIYLPTIAVDYLSEHTAAVAAKTSWEKMHDAKLDALEDILEEAGGNPVLVAYQFKSDAARIMERFKSLKPVNLTATPSSQTEKVINKWSAGEIRLILGHPASMGHGIDGLQDSGSVAVWFGPTWSLELYDQLNARINRQGQKRPVTIARILAEDTIDMAVAAALEAKATEEAALKQAIQEYRKRGHGKAPEFIREAARTLAVDNGTVSFV